MQPSRLPRIAPGNPLVRGKWKPHPAEKGAALTTCPKCGCAVTIRRIQATGDATVSARCPLGPCRETFVVILEGWSA